MEKLYFSCKLLTDVILNQRAATEGPNETLDFIPGNNFLGIAAGRLYAKDSGDNSGRFNKQESWLAFHSGAVRFGDAHPAVSQERTLRVPASFYYPKLGKMEDECYVDFALTEEAKQRLKSKQLKQCRSGFYALGANEVSKAETMSSFAVKSAYDREKRRAKDKKMYGYQSLNKGLEFFFEIEIDDEASALKDRLIEALTGNGPRRIGRSRTSQYGQVRIEQVDAFKQPACIAESLKCGGKPCVAVYADARLIFLDEQGFPTLQPTPQQLGINDPNARVLWESSQVRTFQYAPWNYRRQCFDTDRYGIEKGSVLIVATDQTAPRQSLYVGSYRNEGFGKILYNPAFLKADEEGLVLLRWTSKSDNDRRQSENVGELGEVLTEDKPLLAYLVFRRDKDERQKKVYAVVNKWVHDNKSLFRGQSFASQWGTIRSLAMQYRNKKELKKAIEDYLTHGVAEKRWKEKGRINRLLKFFDDISEESASAAVLNLAAEMAKVNKD